MEICPRCQQRYTRGITSTDFVHSCNSGQATLDQEDIRLVGNWNDYTGNGKVSPSKPMVPSTNELDATDAGIRGGRFTGVTDRGAPRQINRQRQHLEYIKSNLKELE